LALRRYRTGNKIKTAHGQEVEERPARGTRATGDRNDFIQDANKKVMKAALNILSARSCSEGQLRDRLNAKSWADAGLIEDCIRRLKELGYINDGRFAQGYASHRVALKPLGRSRLSRELAIRKVSRNNIDAALDLVFDEMPEETLIDRAIQRRIRTRGKPADRAAEKRMFDHLARLGFEFDLINQKLRTLRRDIKDE
jgi:regulatory protein